MTTTRQALEELVDALKARWVAPYRGDALNAALEQAESALASAPEPDGELEHAWSAYQRNDWSQEEFEGFIAARAERRVDPAVSNFAALDMDHTSAQMSSDAPAWSPRSDSVNDR